MTHPRHYHQLRQYSDTAECHRCGRQWDVGDEPSGEVCTPVPREQPVRGRFSVRGRDVGRRWLDKIKRQLADQ